MQRIFEMSATRRIYAEKPEQTMHRQKMRRLRKRMEMGILRRLAAQKVVANFAGSRTHINFYRRIQRTSRGEVSEINNRQYDFRTETRGDEGHGLLENPENPGFSWTGKKCGACAKEWNWGF